jgi:nitrite reductase/ring-hydroxylating ferredoxin subunit
MEVPMSDMTRRNVLAAGVIGVAGVAAAGCSSSEDTSTADATTGATPADTAEPSPASGGDALVAAADVPVGGGVIVDSDGQYVGLSAVCPHQNCLVSEVSDQKITCPCHGSQFSVADGSVVRGPATSGLAPIDVQSDGDQIVLG